LNELINNFQENFKSFKSTLNSSFVECVSDPHVMKERIASRYWFSNDEEKKIRQSLGEGEEVDDLIQNQLQLYQT